MLVASLMLGGLLPLDARTREHWAPSGAFRMPVGDPYQVYETDARPHAPGPFFVLRGVAWEGERAAHQGVDLASGSAGALVRAAAAGVVIQVADHGMNGGYGTHVVLAHRLPEGTLAYTVYAHLREDSPRVRPGQCVQAGQILGRVGATGHATGPHLHFEVRLAGNPEERWEFSRVEDPLAFVDARLPSHRADTTGVESCLEWAECAALVPPGARAEDSLTREKWWRMLAAGVRGPALDPALSPLDLRDSLLASGLLADDGVPGETTLGGLVEWSELARDLGRARRHGLRAGYGPLRRVFQRGTCEEVLGLESPASHLSALVSRTGHPDMGDAVVLFADLAGVAPEPSREPATRKRPLPAGAAVAAAAATPHARARPDSLHLHGLARRDSLGRALRASGAGAAVDSIRARSRAASGASDAPRDSLGRRTRHTATARGPDSLAVTARVRRADTAVRIDSLAVGRRAATSRGRAHADSSRARPGHAAPASASADSTG